MDTPAASSPTGEAAAPAEPEQAQRLPSADATESPAPPSQAPKRVVRALPTIPGVEAEYELVEEVPGEKSQKAPAQRGADGKFAAAATDAPAEADPEWRPVTIGDPVRGQKTFNSLKELQDFTFASIGRDKKHREMLDLAKQSQAMYEQERQRAEALQMLVEGRGQPQNGTQTAPKADPEGEDDPLLHGIDWNRIKDLHGGDESATLATYEAMKVLSANARAREKALEQKIAQFEARIAPIHEGFTEAHESEQNINLFRGAEALRDASGELLWPELSNQDTSPDGVPARVVKAWRQVVQTYPELKSSYDGIALAIQLYRSQAQRQAPAPAPKAAPRAASRPAPESVLTGSGSPRPAPGGVMSEQERLGRELSSGGQARTTDGRGLGFTL